MIGFEDVFFAAGGSGSPWKTWTGSLDGSAAAIASSVYWINSSSVTQFGAPEIVMLSDSKGIMVAPYAASSIGGGANGGSIQIVLFTVSGTTITVNTTITSTANAYAMYAGVRPDLIRIDDTHALMVWAYDPGGDTASRYQVITIDPAANTVGLGAASNATATVAGGLAWAGTQAFRLSATQYVQATGRSPSLCTLSGTTISLSYPVGAPGAGLYGVRQGGGRISDTMFWLGWMDDASTWNFRSYGLSGTTATVLDTKTIPGGGNTFLMNVNGSFAVADRYTGSGYNYFPVNFNAGTGAITIGSNYAYSTGTGHGVDSRCPVFDGAVQMAIGNVSGAFQVACRSYDTGNVVQSAPVSVYAGSYGYAGVRPFPTDKLRAIAFWQPPNIATVSARILKAS